MEANLHVCPECGHHFRIGAEERVRQLTDPGSFTEMYKELGPGDPLKFRDLKAYPEARAGRADPHGADRRVHRGRGVRQGTSPDALVP